MKNAKKKNAPVPEPQPTIGQFIDARLLAMACNGDFSGPGALSKVYVVRELVETYINTWPTIRYE